jgi:hypothetical protein
MRETFIGDRGTNGALPPMLAMAEPDKGTLDLVIPDRMPKLARISADILIKHAQVDPDIAIMADTPDGLADVLEALSFEESFHPQMVRVLALALGPREAIWWAILCARLEEALAKESPSEALKLAERWVREQEDDLRYEAFEKAQKEGMDKPSSLVCMAAFLSGPSLAPAGQPAQAPAEFLGAQSVATAIISAHLASRSTIAIGLANLLVIGLDVAAGKDGRTLARRVYKELQGEQGDAPAQ